MSTSEWYSEEMKAAWDAFLWLECLFLEIEESKKPNNNIYDTNSQSLLKSVVKKSMVKGDCFTPKEIASLSLEKGIIVSAVFYLPSYEYNASFSAYVKKLGPKTYILQFSHRFSYCQNNTLISKDQAEKFIDLHF